MHLDVVPRVHGKCGGRMRDGQAEHSQVQGLDCRYPAPETGDLRGGERFALHDEELDERGFSIVDDVVTVNARGRPPPPLARAGS